MRPIRSSARRRFTRGLGAAMCLGVLGALAVAIAEILSSPSPPSASAAEPRADEQRVRARVVGLWPNPHERPPAPATACDYWRDLEGEHRRLRARIVESGAQALTIPLVWRSVDPRGGRPEYSKAILLLDAIDLGLDVFLNLAPTWAGRLETPEDLGKEPFDARPPAPGVPSPLDRTIERGRLLIDELVRQVPEARERVRWLALGNEVDLFVARDSETGAGRFFRPDGTATSAWVGYLRLVDALASHARDRLPRAQVGVTVTLSSALGGRMRRHVAALEAATDVLALTVHDAGDPGRFRSALRAVLAQRPRRPVVLQEVAFRAAPGEEAQQSRFVKEAFSAWNEAGSRVPYFGFFSLHDWHHEPEPCEPITGALPCDPCEPACRLCGSANVDADALAVSASGLLRADGSEKPAWTTFRTLATAHATASTPIRGGAL